MSIAIVAQFVPSAGMNWLYQFTNNLTNLTTQNGGALTQLGVTELSCDRVLQAGEHGRELEHECYDAPLPHASRPCRRDDPVSAETHHLLPAH